MVHLRALRKFGSRDPKDPFAGGDSRSGDDGNADIIATLIAERMKRP